MPTTVNDLPRDIKDPIVELFKSDNYCFATTTDDRTPTFYFAQGGLGALNSGKPCGRLRTQHGSGTRIDISNEIKQHLFFDTMGDRNGAYEAVKKIPNDPRALEAFIDGHRQEPRDDDFHLEFTMVASPLHPYSRLHKSGGRIATRPRVANDGICLGIVNYTLNREGEIRFDGKKDPPAYEMPAPYIDHTDQRSVADFLEYISRL